MKKVLFKYFPFIIVVGVWIVFSYPFFAKGLVPFPSTYLADFFSPWNEYVGFGGPVKNNAMPDVISQIFPWKSLVVESWKNGDIPLWNPFSFSGTPLLANYQSAALSPVNILYFIFPFITAWSIQILLQPLLAGIFMLIFARTIKLSSAASIISAISFMFCGFLTSWMAYGTLGYSILFLPLALFSIEKYFQTRKQIYTVLLAITIPLSFFSGHFQISLYFLGFIFLYIFFKQVDTRQIKETIFSLVGVIAGILISAPQLIPSAEFYLQSFRSELFQKHEVIPWSYLPTFIAPDFFGNPVTRNDWLGHYAEWNFYIGVIPLILAGYALIKRNSFIIFFFVTFIMTIFLAFQTPVLDFLIYLKVPVISTSAVSRIIVLASFSAAVLAGFGLDNLINIIKGRHLKSLYICLVIDIFIIAFLWIIVLYPLFIPEDKALIAFSNLRLPTIIFSVLTVLTLVYIFIKKKIVLTLFVGIVIVITAFDLLRFSTKWIPFEASDLIYPKTPLGEFIRDNIEEYDRGLGNYGAEAAINLRLGTIEGYDALQITEYREFIHAIPIKGKLEPEKSAIYFPKNSEFADDVLNLLGVKYIIHKVGDSNMPWTFPIWEYDVNRFELIYEDNNYQVFENHEAFPRAYIVSEYGVLGNENSLNEIFKEGRDLRRSATINKDIGMNLATGEAKIVEYRPNRVKIETNTNGDSILVLSDPYYVGWKAYVNGKEVETLQANHAFRAVVVPGGKSIVEFSYEPKSFKYGVYLMIAGILILITITFHKIKYGKN